MVTYFANDAQLHVTNNCKTEKQQSVSIRGTSQRLNCMRINNEQSVLFSFDPSEEFVDAGNGSRLGNHRTECGIHFKSSGNPTKNCLVLSNMKQNFQWSLLTVHSTVNTLIEIEKAFSLFGR